MARRSSGKSTASSGSGRSFRVVSAGRWNGTPRLKSMTLDNGLDWVVVQADTYGNTRGLDAYPKLSGTQRAEIIALVRERIGR